MLELRQTQGRAGERYWKIKVEEDTVFTEWGAIKDGAHRKHGETKDVPGPKGKTGTKSYYTAEMNAQFNAERLIRKKKEEGYIELGSDIPASSEVDFSKPLPKNLTFSKPKNSLDEEKMEKIERNDCIIFTKKVNGMAAIIYVDDKENVTIYSRRMEDVSVKFPHVLGDIDLIAIPARTILLCEAFMGNGNDKEDFNLMQQIMNAKPDHALRVQEKEGPANFYVYRIPFWDGRYLEDATNEDYLEDVYRLISPHKMTHLFPIKLHYGFLSEAREIAHDEGYEGWVAYQGSGSLNGRSFSFHGKPDRPPSCWKIKYHREDDFCAKWDPKRKMGGGHCANGCQFEDLKQVQKSVSTGLCALCGARMVGDGTFGSGKHSGQVGTFSLYQYTPKGIPVYICEVGTGLTDAQKKDLADVSLFPLCVQVTYDDRRYRSQGDDSNALIFPRVSDIREDKEPSECVNQELIPS